MKPRLERRDVDGEVHIRITFQDGCVYGVAATVSCPPNLIEGAVSQILNSDRVRRQMDAGLYQTAQILPTIGLNIFKERG